MFLTKQGYKNSTARKTGKKYYMQGIDIRICTMRKSKKEKDILEIIINHEKIIT